MKKLKIKYKVNMTGQHYYFANSWSSALKFAKKCDKSIIIAFYGNIEKGYEIDTWKKPSDIEFDIKCETYLN